MVKEVFFQELLKNENYCLQATSVVLAWSFQVELIDSQMDQTYHCSKLENQCICSLPLGVVKSNSDSLDFYKKQITALALVKVK